MVGPTNLVLKPDSFTQSGGEQQCAVFRLLRVASTIPANAPPQQLRAGSGALSLAVRLGVPAKEVLSVLLDPRSNPVPAPVLFLSPSFSVVGAPVCL
jgi:hypothetical protein